MSNKKLFRIMPPKRWKDPWIRARARTVDKLLHPERNPQYYQRHKS